MIKNLLKYLITIFSLFLTLIPFFIEFKKKIFIIFYWYLIHSKKKKKKIINSSKFFIIIKKLEKKIFICEKLINF
jgi:hypothetical protein